MKILNKYTESSATKYLKWFFYNNCANSYLGWRFAEIEILPDNTEKLIVPAGARIWPTPEDKIKWNPVWEHLKGCPRGVCRGRGEKYLPFISVDLDRHDGSIPAKQHIYNVLLTGRLLRKHYGNLRWLVEVNGLNGSSKFFGFQSRPIPVDQANEISMNIHNLLIESGIGKREVFPYYSPQVFLPFRAGKTTIIDTGVLSKCDRRRKVNDEYENFETYSSLAFIQWLQCGTHYNEQVLYKTLIAACSNLPDIAKKEPLISNFGVENTKSIKAVVVVDDTDSFERQRKALLVFCRRNRRVVSVDEALTFIRQNKLFSGQWEVRLLKRRVRVEQILSFISQTFDPSKCQGVHYDIKAGKYDKWAKRHCPNGWRSTVHRVDEYGSVTKVKDRTVADWHFVSVFLSITEYCLLQDKNADNSVPQARVEELWNLLEEKGIIDIPFCPRKWRIVRDMLERRGLIKVNHVWYRDQAMCWEVGQYFPGLGLWKATKIRGMLQPGSLNELIGREKGEVHNTYMQQDINNIACFSPVSRGPPLFSLVLEQFDLDSNFIVAIQDALGRWYRQRPLKRGIKSESDYCAQNFHTPTTFCI